MQEQQSPYIYINNKKWYRMLLDKNKSGLFSDYPREHIGKGLLVSMSHDEKEYVHGREKSKVKPVFVLFKSYIEFALYCRYIPDNNKYFYEIILGECPQKPRFDIDIDNPTIDGEDVKDCLVESIIDTLGQRGVFISINNILIYVSHGFNSNNKYKQSYHIVIDNYCHANNVEARAFYDKVISGVPEKYKEYIDSGVYSSTQQFRIVGSTKIYNNRYKSFQKVWKYKGKDIIHQYPEEAEDSDHEMIMQLEESLITFTGNCSFLPTFQPEEKENNINERKGTTYSDFEDIDDSDIKAALELLAQIEMIPTSSSLFPYTVDNIDGSLIVLKRVRPSFCKTCLRVHENQNPYLFIIGEEKTVYFHCRRAETKKRLCLGKLLTKEPVKEDDLPDPSKSILNDPETTSEKEVKDETETEPKIEIEKNTESESESKSSPIPINIKRKGFNDMMKDMNSIACTKSKIREVLKPFDPNVRIDKNHNKKFGIYSMNIYNNT